jgi:hypothetical protein
MKNTTDKLNALVDFEDRSTCRHLDRIRGNCEVHQRNIIAPFRNTPTSERADPFRKHRNFLSSGTAQKRAGGGSRVADRRTAPVEGKPGPESIGALGPGGAALLVRHAPHGDTRGAGSRDPASRDPHREPVLSTDAGAPACGTCARNVSMGAMRELALRSSSKM